jgi:hypothetical protein
MHGPRDARRASGALNRAADALGAAGALALAARRRPRAGAALVLPGALAKRWAVYRAGFASAADPRYVVDSQRSKIA